MSLSPILEKLDKFMKEPQIRSFNGFFIIFLGIILLGGIGVFIQDHFGNNFVIKCFTFLFGLFIYISIPYGFFTTEKIKDNIIFGEKKTFQELFKIYKTKNYIVFVLFFSYLLSIPILGITILFRIFDNDFLFNFIIHKWSILVYINTIITSMIWFAYHIVYETVTMQKIKTSIALFTAMGTTLTMIFYKSQEFTIMISCMLLSYLWIQYFIEQISES